MNCDPTNCPYFHICGRDIQYKVNDYGIKILTSKLECMFDGKEIKSWEHECPRNRKGEKA